MEKIQIDFVLFDMIGTTIQDNNDGGSIILESFNNAFTTNGFDISFEKLNQQRGKTKRVAIETILQEENIEANLTEKIYHDFMSLLNETVTSFQEIRSASQQFEFLRSKNIKVGIGSGLPLQFMHQLIEQLGWNLENFDYFNSSDELQVGRPDPIMIFDAMEKLGLTESSRVLKIGDTLVDVLEGKNANVLTAMVLTGSQTEADLGTITPDLILNSVADLSEILTKEK